MTGMPVWLRRSHAPGWEVVAVAVALGKVVVSAVAPGRKKRSDRTRSDSRY